jgi:hypothetical protein
MDVVRFHIRPGWANFLCGFRPSVQVVPVRNIDLVNADPIMHMDDGSFRIPDVPPG